MMDLKLKPFDFASAVARAGLRTDGTPIAGGAGSVGGAGKTAKGDFGSALTSALKSVSDSQNEATTMQNELQLDNPTVSLEQTMVSMQKAQIGFQATLQVRNRLVSAYSEIMNMQI